MWSIVSELGIEVPAATSELAGLRDEVRQRACELGADLESAEDFVLVVCELASNVIRHTADDVVRVGLTRDGDSWTIDVSGADELDHVDRGGAPGPDSIGGRGILIAHALMDEVSLANGPTGRVVHCVKHHAIR